MGLLKVSEPLFWGNEKAYLCDAIDEGEVSSQGKFIQLFEEAFAHWSGNKYAVAVSSGIAALETAIWALKMKTIQIPNYTIISCVLAAIRAGAMPSFYEGDAGPHNIMRCHLFGNFNGNVTGKKIVDDSSQYWKPFKPQDIACYSLYANKMITSGEGGILVMNNKELYNRAKSYKDLCRTESRFIHNALGYNFRMSNLQAAVALAQLEQIDRFIEIKQKNRDLYNKYLPDEVEKTYNVEIPWMYLIKTKHDAGDMVRKLRKKDIDCRRNFYPLNKQPCFQHITILRDGHFPVSNILWENTFYLPSGLTLTEKDIIYVCAMLREILRSL